MSSPSARLRVLLSPSAYYPHVGGIEEATRRIALGLQERGHDVLVLTNRWPDGTARSETLDGVQVRRIGLVLPAARPAALARFVVGAPRAVGKLVALARSFRPDVVHVIGAGPNAVYLAALRPAPIVLNAQGEFRNDAHGAFERSLTLRLGLRSLLRSAAVVTAPSRQTLAELEEAFEVRARCEIVPNGVDVAELDAAAPESNGLGRYVLATGRLVPEKGFDVLLRAFAEARPRVDVDRLVLAGEGHLRGELEALAYRLGVGDSVVFLGAVGRPRIGELLRGAHAFVLSSRREAFGIALLEAMAAGAPSVAAATGGVTEYARDGVNALVVAPEDSGALASALVRLDGDSALREQLRAGARRTALAHDWRIVVDRYEQIYREVVRG